MGQTSSSMRSSLSQEEKPDHEHDLSIRASQVRFTTADMTDSMRSPARNLRTSHTPQARGRAARLRPIGGHMVKRTWDQGERPTPKVPSQIAIQDARTTSDLCSVLSENMDIHHSPGSSSPGSSSLSSSQIGNSSTRQKKKHRKKKKVPVTDPNHGKESSQTTTKVKPPTPVASTAFLTQEWARSISQKVDIEDSIAGNSILGARTSPSTVPPRQEQDGTPSNRTETSLSGYVADIPREIQVAEDSVSVSGQPTSNNASSKLPPHEISSPASPSQISQIEPGQRFPEYTSSDPLEAHSQSWDDIHDFPLSYYDDDPSPPEQPSRISAGPHVTFQSSDYSYQSQQLEGLSEVYTQSTSSAVSTIRLSPASSLDSHTLERKLVGIPEHVTLDLVEGDLGIPLPDVTPSVVVDKKEQGLSRPIKPVQDVVASSQGSDPVAKAPSQSLRSSSTGTTAPTSRPTANEFKSNSTLSPTQSPANHIPSTQSPAKCGSEGARDHSSNNQDIESDSEENSEIPLTPSARKGPISRQHLAISSDDSDSEVGSDQMHSPGTTRATTKKTSMSLGKSRSSTTADATSGQESEMSDSSSRTSKSPPSDLSLPMHTPFRRLQLRNKESESSGFRPDGSESDGNTLPKQHRPRTTNTQSPKRRISRRSESDYENSISDPDHTSDRNSSIMSANRLNGGHLADKSRHLRKSKEALRYVIESVVIPSRVKRTGKDAPSTLPGRLSPTLSNRQTREALRGRYLLEAVVIPLHKVVSRFRPPQELRKPQGKQDKKEPPRKRTKTTVNSPVPSEHDESESTEQVVEVNGSDIDIDDEPERLFRDPEEEPLVETPHHGPPSPDRPDTIPEPSTIHEGGGQEPAASKEGENSEDTEEGRRLIVDRPDWADLIELWREHDFQWALQEDRRQTSRVQPYSCNFVFGTAILDTQ